MQTTRLHISGLTPAITERDLAQRFATFGEVRDVDGVGKLDGLGQPRKFAYVTLETTQPKLSRCMNLLSGATWKGAKLRIGEAKPDYQARHELEINPPPRAPRPKLNEVALKRARLKRRLKARRLLRGTQGKEAKDMNVVTLDNSSSHKGWRRTPLDHLIRPLRMRPLHPIPLPPKRQSSKSTSKHKKIPITKKGRRKFDLTRARRTVIDPARYGAVHLTAGGGILGMELLVGGVGGAEVDGGENGKGELEMEDVEVESTLSSGDKEDESEALPQEPTTADKIAIPPPPVLLSSTPPPVRRATTPPPLDTATNSSAAPQANNPLPSLAMEKGGVLALLDGMFPKDEEWGGRESLSGDEVDSKVVPGQGKRDANEVDGDDQVEQAEEEMTKVTRDQLETEAEGEEENVSTNSDEPGAPIVQERVQHTALKDMFRPQEESGGFLLGLEIDLDPDAESFLPASLAPHVRSPSPSTQPLSSIPAQTRTQAQEHTIQYTPDPREIMFFPTFSDSSSKRDVFSVIKEKGWEWAHPGSSDEIRTKWDAQKVELTREYTKRHREAVKRRRRGGTGKGEET